MTDKWGSASEQAYFDKLFESLEKFSDKQNAPMVIGEFGADFKNNNASRKLYAQYFVTCAAEHGIKCFWWDTGDMALFDRSKCTVTHPEIVKALTDYTPSKTPSKPSAEKTDKSDRPVVKAEAESGSIKLKWSAIDGAYAYRIYKLDSESGKYTRIKTIKGNFCTIKNAESGSHKFIVCAVKKSGSSYKKIGEYSKAVTVSI